MRRRLAVLAALLTLGGGGCGTESDDNARPGGRVSAPTSTAPRVSVESVTMQQSGGIAGIDHTWQVTGDTDGAEQVFAAAADPALREAAAREVSPICCDFFVYDIVIRYDDGDTVRLVTSDAVKQDPAVKALMQAILATHPATAGGGRTG